MTVYHEGCGEVNAKIHAVGIPASAVAWVNNCPAVATCPTRRENTRITIDVTASLFHDFTIQGKKIKELRELKEASHWVYLDKMATSKQQENMLLTEHFTWPPIVCYPQAYLFDAMNCQLTDM